MNRLDKKIQKRFRTEWNSQLPDPVPEAFHIDYRKKQTAIRAKAAFAAYESEHFMNTRELLFAQASLIQKRWWIIQGLLLVLLWVCLYMNGTSGIADQTMGVAAPLFGILIIPELWKNRSCNAVEVEGAAYFSLRQIFSARILLFAFIDLFLISIFYAVSVITLNMLIGNFVVDFLLPLTVTCCICFLTLTGQYFSSEYVAFILCIVWSTLWMLLIINKKIYQVLSLPIWIGVWFLALAVLFICVKRSQKMCDQYWEVERT